MSRQNARANVVKLVYEFLIAKEYNPFTLEIFMSEGGDDAAYTERVYKGVVDNYDSLSSLAEGYSKGFALERIYNIDLAIILTALYEMDYCEDIPDRVAINEALNLSKVYSTEKSYSFINGILATHLQSRQGEEQ